MKPFFNLGCALVAWNALARLAQERDPDSSVSHLPLQALRQGKHSHQFVYETPQPSLQRYRGVVLEPLQLLDQRPDGRWQWQTTPADAELNRLLQKLLQNQLQSLGLTVREQPGEHVARLRVTVRSRHGRFCGQALLPTEPGATPSSPLLNGIAAYLHHIASVARLEDSYDGRLLGGGINLKAAAPPAQPIASWQELLACAWLPTPG